MANENSNNNLSSLSSDFNRKMGAGRSEPRKDSMDKYSFDNGGYGADMGSMREMKTLETLNEVETSIERAKELAGLMAKQSFAEVITDTNAGSALEFQIIDQQKRERARKILGSDLDSVTDNILGERKSFDVAEIRDYFTVIRSMTVTTEEVLAAIQSVQGEAFNCNRVKVSRADFLFVLQALEIIAKRHSTLNWETKMLDMNENGWLSRGTAQFYWNQCKLRQPTVPTFNKFMSKRKDLDKKLAQAYSRGEESSASSQQQQQQQSQHQHSQSVTNALRSTNVHRKEILSLAMLNPDAGKHF
uniref:Uncharacterized protein n=1 Tax=Lotharella globosa TaxID=91324 RepID=A0A7S3YU20_9EUKA